MPTRKIPAVCLLSPTDHDYIFAHFRGGSGRVGEVLIMEIRRRCPLTANNPSYFVLHFP